ncbi:MAG: hypothetical protein ABIP53_01340 [Candidatus Limnocylindrales bacterium]
MKVYLEVGQKKVFAVGLDWIGLARSGKIEAATLETLLEYAPRYLKTMGAAAADLKAPRSVRDLDVVERLIGNATTDFGAPGVVPGADKGDVADKELESHIKLLRAAWHAFDRAADSASGHELAPSGPRGGGRELAKIRDHVRGAEAGYTGAVGGKARESDAWDLIQHAFVAAVRARARGEIPDRGPRGGQRWPARFAIRRSAWHALDHTWEIEDRVSG